MGISFHTNDQQTQNNRLIQKKNKKKKKKSNPDRSVNLIHDQSYLKEVRFNNPRSKEQIRSPFVLEWSRSENRRRGGNWIDQFPLPKQPTNGKTLRQQLFLLAISVKIVSCKSYALKENGASFDSEFDKLCMGVGRKFSAWMCRMGDAIPFYWDSEPS